MKITTYRQILRELPAKLYKSVTRAKRGASADLEKLDMETCTQAQVVEVLERHEVHPSWARRPYCSCCDSEADAVAKVDDEGFHGTTICLSCAREAVAKLEAAK